MNNMKLRRKFKKNENSIETFVSCPCSISCSCGTYDDQSMSVYRNNINTSRTLEYRALWG
uniref:hypothetical protein n=1 Tax=Lachnoclostridium phocaeense TaxID=1871021 RepID=UPI0026DB9CC7|nr:hypothetical protein [Lachnoclostridium phocaeense]